MEMVFRIAAIGILVSVLAQVLNRAGREDMAMLASLAGLITVLLMVVGLVAEFFGDVREIFQLY